MSTSEFYNVQGYAKDDREYLSEDRFKKILSIFDQFHKQRGTYIDFLDIGCGEGGFIRFLNGVYPNVTYTGFDISTTAINNAIAKCNLPNVKFKSVNVNVDKLVERFDFIVAGEIIEHIEDTDTFILSLKNLLKPDGILVITTPNLGSWLDRLMLLFGMQPFSTEVSFRSRMFGRRFFYTLNGVSHSDAVGHLRLFTTSALYDFLHYHGFKIVKRYGYWQQNKLLNVLISNIAKNLAEGQIVVVQKLD